MRPRGKGRKRSKQKARVVKRDPLWVDGERPRPMYVDYKDVELLKKLVNRHGRIVGRRKTGCAAASQHAVTSAIKRARFMALLPYVGDWGWWLRIRVKSLIWLAIWIAVDRTSFDQAICPNASAESHLPKWIGSVVFVLCLDQTETLDQPERGRRFFAESITANHHKSNKWTCFIAGFFFALLPRWSVCKLFSKIDDK